MIFSKQKWDSGAEIRPFVTVAYNTEFDIFEAPLRGAWDAFLMPLLGTDLAADITTIYGKPDAEVKEKQLLYLAQKANALLSMWYNFDEINTYISDSGMFRQESGDSKTLYKYQQQSLKDTWKNKGFNALDELLAYLEKESETFSNFAACPGNTLFKSAIVRNTSAVSEYYFINNSRLVFLRLLPHFRTVERTVIAPRLKTVYSEMVTALSGANPAEKFVKLRDALVPVVVNYSVARLMKETGSLTDRGLFFETFTQTDDMVTTSTVSDDRMMMQATMAEWDAVMYWGLVEMILKSDFQFTSSVSSRIPKRDNNNKKSFWE
jgi:hypothetical protein